jgi:hypothetical protein
MPQEPEHQPDRMRCRTCGKIRKPPDKPSCECGRTAWVYDAPKDQTLPTLGMKGAKLGRRTSGSYGTGKRG